MDRIPICVTILQHRKEIPQGLIHIMEHMDDRKQAYKALWCSLNFAWQVQVGLVAPTFDLFLYELFRDSHMEASSVVCVSFGSLGHSDLEHYHSSDVHQVEKEPHCPSTCRFPCWTGRCHLVHYVHATFSFVTETHHSCILLKGKYIQVIVDLGIDDLLWKKPTDSAHCWHSISWCLICEENVKGQVLAL